MRCFYAPETEAHDPSFRLTNGRVQQNAERPERARLLRAALDQAGLTTEEPPAFDRAAYEAVHTPRFLDFLQTAWETWQTLPGASEEVIPNAFPRLGTQRYPESFVGRAGWHAGDVSAPIGPGSWQATQRAADCALAAADAVLDGAWSAYALSRPPGHHTSAEVAAGHCLMNVSAIAAERLRSRHGRVAVLDIDTHHGNGTQDIFYERGDVLFVSVHTDTANYYPFFTGYAEETGRGKGEGFNLNLPVPATTEEEDWCAAIGVGLERIAAFAPDALVLSLGLDAHRDDPLKGMRVGDAGFTRAARMIREAGYPTVLVQEGGYLSDSLTAAMAAFLEGWLESDA
ncbi:histone deacetylase family protein [Roseivivax sediminis]|uniref:Acetoin utilization deacetylase AcuC n=1 Tax=Roseivivax sediminis TaxID=936889 RepID=A0A1I2AGF5_9RHOB|nr:histone deacetylase family protein [Roseivivax sediminis]SFE42063.1 Acetoin utilization deacetylase AcuC [Roseivivax sediminis]